MYDKYDTEEERFIRQFIAGGGLVVIAALSGLLIMLDRGIILG